MLSSHAFARNSLITRVAGATGSRKTSRSSSAGDCPGSPGGSGPYGGNVGCHFDVPEVSVAQSLGFCEDPDGSPCGWVLEMRACHIRSDESHVHG